MDKLDKAYILRLYALHDQIATEINALAGELLFGGDADKIVASVDLLDVLTDELETIFAEVLTDEERTEKEGE
ncbi:MAG: hypothetical protein MOB07_26215 [Acidobacteria bacterium]|nr:hypothetical protein [Acidobacteriota bacterium]